MQKRDEDPIPRCKWMSSVCLARPLFSNGHALISARGNEEAVGGWQRLRVIVRSGLAEQVDRRPRDPRGEIARSKVYLRRMCREWTWTWGRLTILWLIARCSVDQGRTEVAYLIIWRILFEQRRIFFSPCSIVGSSEPRFGKTWGRTRTTHTPSGANYPFTMFIFTPSCHLDPQRPFPRRGERAAVGGALRLRGGRPRPLGRFFSLIPLPRVDNVDSMARYTFIFRVILRSVLTPAPVRLTGCPAALSYRLSMLHELSPRFWTPPIISWNSHHLIFVYCAAAFTLLYPCQRSLSIFSPHSFILFVSVGYWTSSMPAALVENANSAYSRSQTAAFCSFTFADHGKAL
jgi:hypothetical protein